MKVIWQIVALAICSAVVIFILSLISKGTESIEKQTEQQINDKPFVPSNNTIISPAHGFISSISSSEGQTKVTIELSLFDIHDQYAPVSGIVLAKQVSNTSVSTTISSPLALVQVIQRTGYIYQTIENNTILNEIVSQGSIIGDIKRGSHVDIIFPSNVRLLCHVGQRVDGTKNVLARFT